MKITKLDSNYCGGFKPPKGHLDTQMFPECEGYETDRNVVKKTVEKRKKQERKRKTASIDKKAELGWPITTHDAKGIWERWKGNEIDDKMFVDKMIEFKKITGFPGLSSDPMTRDAVIKILDVFLETSDYASTAMDLGKWLAVNVEKEKEKAEVFEKIVTKFNLKHYKKS